MDTLQPEFCPVCGIGLNNSERRVGFCYNCKSNWEPSDYPSADDEEKNDDETNTFYNSL